MRDGLTNHANRSGGSPFFRDEGPRLNPAVPPTTLRQSVVLSWPVNGRRRCTGRSRENWGILSVRRRGERFLPPESPSRRSGRSATGCLESQRLSGRSKGREMGTVITLAVVYITLVLVLPLGLSGAVSYRALPTGRRCPRCVGTTLRLQARLLDRISRILPANIDRRWCIDCGWEGIVRTSDSAVPVATDLDGAGLEHAGSRTADVRSIIVDGIAWRVRLEYWIQAGLYCGRLVFVAPSGRHWLDGRPLSAPTGRALLRQAQALSDRLLVSRVRELVSD